MEPRLIHKMRFSHTMRAAFSPDGASLLVGGWEDELVVWDVATGRPCRSVSQATTKNWSVSWSPDGRGVMTCGVYGVFWRYLERPTSGLSCSVGGATYDATWSNDGTLICSVHADGNGRLWHAATAAMAGTLNGHTGYVKSVGWSPDGRRLATGGRDGTVRLWDADTLEQLSVMSGHGDDVNAVSFSPDGSAFASSGDDGEVIVWDVAAGRAVLHLDGHSGWVHDVAYAADGRYLVSAGTDRAVNVWDAATGRPVSSMKPHDFGVHAVTCSPCGKRFSTCGYDGLTMVWEFPWAEARPTGVWTAMAADALAGDALARLALADWLEERGGRLDLAQAYQLRAGNLYPAGYWAVR